MQDNNKNKLHVQAKLGGVWLTLSIGCATVAGLVSFIFVPFYLYTRVHPNDWKSALDLAQPFVLVLLAFTTFSTVIWRGLISAEQTKIQLDQFRNMSRQIDQTQENNLAQLLQKGAELLSEKDHPSKIAAGIVILQTVAESEGRKFTKAAMNLITEYIQNNGEKNHDNLQVKSAIKALGSIYENTKFISDRILSFIADDNNVDWQIVVGATSVKYRSGVVRRNILNHDYYNKDLKLIFEGVTFRNCNISLFPFYVNNTCHFIDCKISSLYFIGTQYYKFKNCCFSGANIAVIDLNTFKTVHLKDLFSDDCYVYERDFPSIRDLGESGAELIADLDWGSIIESRQKEAFHSWPA